MRKLAFTGTGLGVFLLLLLGMNAASAQSFRTGDNITVPSGETVNRTLFATGRNIDIAATVNGDIFCAGQNITITGQVNGDIICAGQTITINGEVEGDVRLAGQSVTINAPVSMNASIATQTATISSAGSIGRDISLAGDRATINGSIGRDIAGAATHLEINATVERDVTATVDNLTLSNNAEVGGDVDYTSGNRLDQADGATVAGTITQNEPTQEPRIDYGSAVGLSAGFAIYIFITALFSALVLIALFPHAFNAVTDTALARPLTVAGIGLAALVGGPVIFTGLLMTVIGIPLAFMFLYVWLFIMFLSGVFSAYYLGRLLLREITNPFLLMLGGGALLLLSYFVPILGLLTMFAALIMGSGMLLLTLWQRTPKPAYKVRATSNRE